MLKAFTALIFCVFIIFLIGVNAESIHSFNILRIYYFYYYYFYSAPSLSFNIFNILQPSYFFNTSTFSALQGLPWTLLKAFTPLIFCVFIIFLIIGVNAESIHSFNILRIYYFYYYYFYSAPSLSFNIFNILQPSYFFNISTFSALQGLPWTSSTFSKKFIYFIFVQRFMKNIKIFKSYSNPKAKRYSSLILHPRNLIQTDKYSADFLLSLFNTTFSTNV